MEVLSENGEKSEVVTGGLLLLEPLLWLLDLLGLAQLFWQIQTALLIEMSRRTSVIALFGSKTHMNEFVDTN